MYVNICNERLNKKSINHFSHFNLFMFLRLLEEPCPQIRCAEDCEFGTKMVGGCPSCVCNPDPCTEVNTCSMGSINWKGTVGE